MSPAATRQSLDRIDTSKTHRFYLLLKERIASGALPPGHRLPSEPQLAESHGLSRVTIRRALDGLEREGLITRQAGAGTFVAAARKGPVIVGDLSDMLASLVAMGRATRVKLLSFGFETPASGIADALKLAPGERTQRSQRVRYVEDRPLSFLTTHVPERIGATYSEADLATTPLLTLIERSGITVERAEQSITATLAGPDSAEALNVEIGAPLLSLTRVVFDRAGRGVEHLAALYRPDMHAFHMELRRTGQGGERRWQPAPRARRSTKPNSIPQTAPSPTHRRGT